MGQIVIYCRKEKLERIRLKLSDAIHESIVEAFEYPSDKKFQRFIPLDSENFIAYDRSENYIIIEISIFEGRSIEVKKKLIKLLFKNIEVRTGISPNDVEITIFETPKSNWGIRGLIGDELKLNYKVNL